MAAAVLVVTGLLTTAPPPAGAASPSPPQIVVTATDFGTTVRARLTVTPGGPGRNLFTVRLADYDTGDPVAADGVVARFALPTHPALGATSLDLSLTASTGTYAAAGNNLSLPGRWRVTLVVARGAESVELALDVVVPASLPPPSVAEAPGQPSVYSVDLGQGRSVQVYADPGTPGANELHATFFAADGTEDDVASATLAPAATPRRLGPGHFVADLDIGPGRTTVEVTGITSRGRLPVHAHRDRDSGMRGATMRRRGRATAAATAFAVVALVATGCGGGGGGSGGGGATPSTSAAARPRSTATLAIVEPANQAAVAPGPLTVKLDLQGGRIVTEATRNLAPDEGHIHLTVDDKLVSMAYGLEQQIEATPGTHYLVAEYVAGDHAPFQPRVTATRAFVVQ